jgi:hypothetical protein
MKKIVIGCVFLATLISACGETSPLKKLKSSKDYADLTPAFWLNERTHKTALWVDGKAYCEGNQNKPNCAAVLQVLMFGAAVDLPDVKPAVQPIQAKKP